MATDGPFTLDDTGTTTGEPSGDTSNGGDYVDPAALAGGGSDGAADDRTFDPDRHIGPDRLNADGTYRRKRAKRGSSRAASGSSKAKALPPSVTAIEGILYSVHAMLAAGLAPELALDPTEANVLAKAVAEVQAHYPNSVFSPAVAAWVNLGMTAGAVYIPRVINIRARLQQEEAAARAARASSTLPGVAVM